MMRFAPRSLTGQIALLVALALFVAQAINFAMIFRERRSNKFYQITSPAITRVVDGAERLRDGRFREAPAKSEGRERDRQRWRLRLLPANPVPPGLERRGDVEDGLRQSMREANVPVGDIVTGVQPILPNDPRFERMSAMKADRMKRWGAELHIAVEIPGKGWLTMISSWPRGNSDLIWRLIAQTLFLYVAVLIPVLWVGSRVGRQS